jgi:hypothetical protein
MKTHLTTDSHVRPNQRYSAAWNTSSLVADLDGNVLFAFNYNDLDRRKLSRSILPFEPEPLDDGAERVLEDSVRSCTCFQKEIEAP